MFASFIMLMKDANITGWARKPFYSCGYEIDHPLPKYRLAVEIDGMEFHTGHRNFTSDRHKRNVLENNGWTVRQFTWEQLAYHPDIVVATVIAAVEQIRLNRGR